MARQATKDKPPEAEPDVVEAEAVEVDEKGEPTGLHDPPALLPAKVEAASSTAMVAQGEISVDDLKGQHDKIVAAMQGAMTEGVHYGLIPGVKKPSLFKPGAETLLVLFRLAIYYESEKLWGDDGHLTVITTARLEHIPTGLTIATGEGLCTTRESRYAYRKGERVCPECGEPQVREGKGRGNQPGNWYCWKKEGGCGATWPLEGEQADAFEKMEVGARIPNPDLADAYNTVLKMANKRALVAAILNGTAASDVFTQDMEDAKVAAEAEVAPVEWDVKTMRPVDGPNDWRQITERLDAIDGGMDWATWIQQAVAAIDAGDGGVKDAPKDRQKEIGYRISNVVVKLEGLTEGRDFPPPSRAECIEAFALGFDGVLLDGPAEPLSPDETDLYPSESESAEDTPVEPEKPSDAALPGVPMPKGGATEAFGGSYENPAEKE